MMDHNKFLEFSVAVRGYHYHKSLRNPIPNQKLQCSHEENNLFDMFAIKVKALSGDFQCVCGKLHAQTLLGVQWCAMSIFLFLKFSNFIKGIMHRHSIFKKPKSNVFIFHILTF